MPDSAEMSFALMHASRARHRERHACSQAACCALSARVLQLAARGCLLGAHQGDVIGHAPGDKEELHEGLALAKNVALAWLWRAENDEDHPGIPFVLQMADHRQ